MSAAGPRGCGSQQAQAVRRGGGAVAGMAALLAAAVAAVALAVALLPVAAWAAEEGAAPATASATPAPGQPAPFVIVNKAQPFMDAEALDRRLSAADESGVPYLLEVTGVYDHAEWPSFQAFCQLVSRHVAQGHATVVIAYPLYQGDVTLVAVDEALERALGYYLEHGVAPVAVTFDGVTQADAVGRLAGADVRVVNGRSLGDGVEDGTATVFLPGGASAQAVRIDASASEEEFRRTFDSLAGASVSDLGAMDLTLAVGGTTVRQAGGVAGYEVAAGEEGQEPSSGTIAPGAQAEGDPYEGYRYGRELMPVISVNMTSGNRWLLALSVAAIVVFSAFMLRQRRLVKRTFVRKGRR